WLTVENLRPDISLFDILGGHALPRRLDVTGARVLLRFDREGRLLTSLPEQLFHGTKHPVSVESIPDVELHESQITFRKEGSSDLVLDNVHATLHKDGNQLVLSGEFNNVQWGPWTIGGGFRDGSTQV